MYYTLRFNAPLDTDISFLHKYCKCLIYHEIGEHNKTPHFQGVITLLKTETALRTRLNYLGYKGGDMSIAKVKDVDKYFPYIVKDGNLIINTLLSEEELQKYIEMDLVTKEKLVKKKSFSYTQEMAAMFCLEPDAVMLSWTHNLKDARLQQATDFVLAYVKCNFKVIDKFILKRFVYTCYAQKYSLDDFKQGLLNDLRNDL